MRWRSLLRQADACAERGMPYLAYKLRNRASELLNGSKRRAWAQDGCVVVRP